MKTIEFESAHRRRHFDLFQAMEAPHFSLVAPVPVHVLGDFIKVHRLHFSSTIVYLISKVANEIPEFKRRIRKGVIVEHDLVHPSFTVNTDEADVFSYCYVDFTNDYPAFARAANDAQQRMKKNPSLEDGPDRDDYLFMSSFPWVHFTGFTHAMHTPARDSVPRFTWGKTEKSGDRLLMPLGVQAHHGVVDGRNVGMFYQQFTKYCMEPESAIEL